MSETIFRSIQIDQGEWITLGEPIPPNSPLKETSAGSNQWTVEAGHFGHAASITIETASTEGPVQRMDFTYESGTNYDTLLAKFVVELGPPKSGGKNSPNTVWTDSATTFRLFKTGADGASVGSQLSDGGGDA